METKKMRYYIYFVICLFLIAGIKLIMKGPSEKFKDNEYNYAVQVKTLYNKEYENKITDYYVYNDSKSKYSEHIRKNYKGYEGKFYYTSENNNIIVKWEKENDGDIKILEVIQE